jgi:hypothetical protein
MTGRSRVPSMPGAPREIVQFFDAIDRRQLAVSQLEDLSGAASTADIIAKINAILAAHRTK